MDRGTTIIAGSGRLVPRRGRALLLAVDGDISREKSFWQNDIVRNLFWFSLTLNAVSWGVLFFFVSMTRDRIILHYNVYLGVDIIGAPYLVYWVPAVGLLFWTVNLFLAQYLYVKQERIISYALLLASVMLEFGTIIAAISLASVNY
ncbi:MAG: hypothetical protein WCG84_01430 [Candidatus Moraniibacteriota bacterium]